MLPRKKQTGAVNMLLVSLAGLAALAITANNLNSIRGSQEGNLSLQANVQAAGEAWRGTEVVAAYLRTAGTSNPNGTTLNPEGAGFSATITGVEQWNGSGWVAVTGNSALGSTTAETRYRIHANISGQGAAGTSKMLEAYYELKLPALTQNNPQQPAQTSSGQYRLPDTVSIHSNLTLQGGINIEGDSNANFMVDGNATLSGSVTGLDQLCATGDITIQSGITVNYVCSNKSVTISQGATVDRIVAIGQVNLNSGNAKVETVLSNGKVLFSGGGTKVTNVNATGDVSISGGAGQITGTLNTEGNVTWDNTFPANIINANGNVTYRPNSSATIRSRGNVTLSAGDSKVANVYALGWVNLLSSWGAGISNILRGGSTVNWKQGNTIGDGIVKGQILGTAPKAWEPLVNVFRDPNLTLEISPVSIPIIEPVVMERPVIDANTFKESANYVFFYENGKRRVTVKNVEGIADGTYFIASYNTHNTHDYLCTALSGNYCSEPPLAEKGRTLCMGFGNGNSCFDQSTAGNWVFNGQSLAPGTAWFEGNLKLANGKFVNTFLSTGHIDITQGSVRVYSPNYAGYAAMCTDSKGFSLSTDHRLAGIKPKNFCSTEGEYISTPLGNVALLAGSFNSSGVFSGGNINLSASNEIYGTIMAGGVLKTSGSTKMYGALLVANTPKTGSTQIQGGVNIFLSDLPETYDPDVIPCVGDDCDSDVDENQDDSNEAAPGSNGLVTRLWTRYAD